MDPYKTLGVDPGADPEQLRAAYRELVKRHHPDHNGGSARSAARFEEIQAAYAEAQRNGQATSVERRLAEIESELAQARQHKSRESKPAPATATDHEAPSPVARTATPEELGQYQSDDSLSSIIDDAATGMISRIGGWLSDR